MKILVRLIIISFVIVAEAQQEIILKDVQVEGNIISSSNTIIFTSGLRKGLSVSSSEFPRAVKRLWQLGLFDDIQIRYDNEDEEGLEIEDPVNQWDALWEREYLDHVNDLALSEVKKKVSPKQYQIFHLYCIKDQDVKKIAVMLGISTNEVYLAKNRVLPLYEESVQKVFGECRESVLGV